MSDFTNKGFKGISFKKVLALIPKEERKGGIGVVLGSVALALLDFVGVAVLIPILLLVLNEEETFQYPIMQRIYDISGIESFNPFVIAVCICVLVIIIIKSGLVLLISNSINKYTCSLYRGYSARMFEIYLSKGLLFIRSNNTSQLIHNINGICLRFTEGVIGRIFAITTQVILLILIGCALLLYDGKLLLLALAVFIPLGFLYTVIFKRKIERSGRVENSLFVEQNKILYETFKSYSDIEINNAGKYVSERFDQGLCGLTETRRKANLIRVLAGYMPEISLVLGVVTMIIFGILSGNSMASMKVSLGVFAIAAYKIIPSVNRIISNRIEYKRNSFAAEKIAEEFGSSHDIKPYDCNDSKLPFTHTITLTDVSFRYEDKSPPVLDNYNLIIHKGDKIGIRGNSGAGKTTLFNLICGLFEPSSGSIRIDGTELTPANRREWQNNIAYVSQDVFLPDISIAENIAFGIARSEIDKARLNTAIDAASLREFITGLPDGADTVAGESGCRLSGGQRQRIGIARALYKEAEVLLLDEATSSLDPQTEQEIMDAIKVLSGSRSDLTILIISHRESTIAFCDYITDIK